MRVLGRRGPNVKGMAARGDIDGLATVACSGTGEGWDKDAMEPRQVQARVRALRALAELYGPDVERGVRGGLVDPSPEVRLAAVRAADTAQLSGVANGLVAGVVYWNEEAFSEPRAEADRVLERWQLPDRPERLGVVLAQNPGRELTDEHRLLLQDWIREDPRELAGCQAAIGARIVTQISDPQASAEEADRAGEVMALIDRGGVEALVELLWGGSPPPVAIRLAARLRDNRLLEPLVAAFGSGGTEVRRLVVEALGAIEDSRGVGVLLHATRDPEHEVRGSANRALESMGVAAVIFGLAATIKPELAQDAIVEGATTDQLAPGAQEAER